MQQVGTGPDIWWRAEQPPTPRPVLEAPATRSHPDFDTWGARSCSRTLRILHEVPRVLMRPNPNKPASDLIGVLDIGTSKTVCLIVAVPSSRGSGLWRHEGAQVVGFGQRASRGLKAGVVIELDAAEQALRAAVTQAEQMAGAAIEDVILGVTGGQFKSSTFQADTRIEDRIVGDADVDRLMAAARRYAAARRAHAAAPEPHRLPPRRGCRRSRSPRHGREHAGRRPARRDGRRCAAAQPAARGRARLPVAGRQSCPRAYASGLAATTEEERRLGTTCIDMGAGTTSLSMFADGQLLSIDTVAVGGQHVTFDIARTLSTPFAEAERIKTLYGSTGGGSHRMTRRWLLIPLPGRRNRPCTRRPRRTFNGIIASRMSDLLAHVAERIERSGVAHLAAHRVVLTGGGSQLPGLADVRAGGARPAGADRPA